MKIIAKTGERGAEYIAIVSHTELEKLTDKYYGKLADLKVGEVLDLGTGHDFRNQILAACEKMTSAMSAFEQARDTLTKFALMVGDLPSDEAKP